MGERNVLGGELEPCGTDPVTGFYRDGCCNSGADDLGSHTICAVVTEEFLRHQRKIGNDLSTPRPEYLFPGLVPGDRWCVTAANWLRAHRDGAAAFVVLASTHQRALDIVPIDVLREHAIDVPATPGSLEDLSLAHGLPGDSAGSALAASRGTGKDVPMADELPPAEGSPGLVPASGLRASHQDRDQVVEILRIAAGDGRLTADELDERLESALKARTYAELAALTADLPPAAVAGSGAATVAPKDLVQITCKGSSTERTGRWVVPREMEISAIGASVTLNFAEAVVSAPVLRIRADVKGSSLLLLTRPGIEVDADEVSLTGGTVRVQRPESWHQPTALRIEVSGTNRGGTILARPPRRSFWQWLLRRPRPYDNPARMLASR